MKKKLVAIAIAAALAPAAAMAEVAVYGKMHLSVDNYSYGNATQDGMYLASNSSRLGFKGGEDLGSGLKAVYQFELGIDPNTGWGGARDSFLGVTGGFGTILAGRLGLANQYAYDANYFGDQVGDTAQFVGTGNAGGRVSNVIAYAAPAMGDLSLLFAFVPTTTGAAANKESSFTARAGYAANGIKGGLSYQSVGTNSTTDNIGILAVGGTYDMGTINVGGQFVNISNEGQVAGADRTVFTVGGSFKLSDTGTVKAQFSSASEIGSSKDGATMLAVGYDHSLSKSTTAYVAFASVSNDTAGTFGVGNWGHGDPAGAPAAGQDPSAFSVGLVHAF